MARSLLDTVDLARVRAAAKAAEGTGPAAPGAVALACLVAGGALQHDPDDPGWADRDRLVLGGAGLAAVAAAVFAASGAAGEATAPRWHDAGSRALAVALGLAAASDLDGAVWRVYAVLDAAVCDDGLVWEAARAAAAAAVPLTLAVIASDRAGADRVVALLEGAGWPQGLVPAGDPAALLGGLDHALTSPGAAAVVERP